MNKSYLVAIIAMLFLYSCGSSDNEQQQPNFKSDAVADAPPSGEDIYKRTCIACHQAKGEGVAGAFPPLAKSDYLAADKERAIKQVLQGSSGEITVNGKTYNNVMPPQPLNDAECAAVLTYVYCSFGNNACNITPDEVKQVREKL
ncbi:MAG: nirK [Flavipsychrobacter sp.]|jgi:nitrite reductase (NO-forming)|nr:nirK [Flavipsychrobacter sp.]